MNQPLRLMSPVEFEHAPLRLRLLGGLQLAGLRAGTSAGYESRHHVRAVLALAGSSVRGVDRDQLVELLWPQSAGAAARNRLYHTVHLARQALAALAWDDEWVVVRNARVQLDERVWCDVQQLELAAAALQRGPESRHLSDDQLHEVLPLCSGDWLPGLDLGPASAAEQQRVRGLQGVLLHEAVLRHADQGDTPAQRALLHSLLLLEPTDEWAHRELMRLDLAAGRRHAVLRTFETLGRALGQQLGLRPSAETQALAAAASAALLAAPLPASEAPCSDVSNGSMPGFAASEFGTPLVGREGLIQGLAQQLNQGPGLWNLTGLSGVGKTSVMGEVARRVAPGMTDGVCLVRLGDLAEHDSAAAACARALNLIPTAQCDALALVGKALAERKLLLVLDDLDAASGGAALLAMLDALAGEGRVHAGSQSGMHAGSQAGMQTRIQTRVVACTRARMDAAHAVHLAVPPLPTPAPEASLNQAQRFASFSLFQMRCPVGQQEWASPGWLADAIRLVRRLDGLPLAIELAAARTAIMTPGEILAQLNRTLGALAANAHADVATDPQDRHRCLQASLDWSVRLLSAGGRAGYRALAVFPGPFSAPDALALMAACAPPAGSAPHHLAPVLEELLAAGLVVRLGHGESLHMLHLPRAHARAQAQEQGQWAALLTARLALVCAQLDAHPLHFESPQYATHLQRVSALEDDAAGLLVHAQATDPARLVRMLVPLCDLWAANGSVLLSLHWGEIGIHQAQALGMHDAEMNLRVAYTNSLRIYYDAAKVEVFSRSLLPALHPSTSASLRARCVASRSLALAHVGRHREATDLLTQLLTETGWTPADAGYWTVYVRLAASGNAPANVQVDLNALRQRFAGSRLWPLLIVGEFQDFAPAGNWAERAGLAQELISQAQALSSTVHHFCGITARARCEFGLDDAAAGLRSMEEGCELVRASGWSGVAAEARIQIAACQLRLHHLDAAEANTQMAVALLGPDSEDPTAHHIPLLRAAALCLRGHSAQAAHAWLATDIGSLEQVADDLLFYWAESGALVAAPLGCADATVDLVAALRQMDVGNDVMPHVRRFRDCHFGPGGCDEQPLPEQLDGLRERLRAGVRGLHQQLRVGAVA